MFGLEALPTYKRVVAWFSGPAEGTKRYFQRLYRLNKELNSSQWTVYERKYDANEVRLALSIDSPFYLGQGSLDSSGFSVDL